MLWWTQYKTHEVVSALGLNHSATSTTKPAEELTIQCFDCCLLKVFKEVQSQCKNSAKV
jgi:hypothetical protein